MSTTKILNKVPEELALRVGGFELMPTNPVAPLIVSQPVRNINQNTHIVSVEKGIVNYQPININQSIIKLVKDTAFNFYLVAADPSNTSDRNNTQGLSYKWRKDGSYVYNVNNINGGVGVPGIAFDAEISTPLLTGQWICEVSNEFGVTESQPLDIEIVDLLQHPKLYTNLILNGDGDGGLDGWISDPDIQSSPFLNNSFLTRNFGSYRLGNFITFDSGSDTTSKTPFQFRFSSADGYNLFYRWYSKRLQLDPTFANPFIKSNPQLLNESEQWVSFYALPQIVANEDYIFNDYAAFFPGIRWMDLYNKNNKNNLIGLTSEFSNQTPSYFTRLPIKFEKFNGRAVQSMTQTVDVSDISDYVDGNVIGVNEIISQFFAYVGIGISDYKIVLQTTEGEKELNYYVADTEEIYNKLVGSSNALEPGEKYSLIPNSDIKIVPKCYDQVYIDLDYLDEQNSVISSTRIDGPTDRDIWALKEKTYFPLSLFGLFEFIEPNNNTIKVFDQKYTDTNSLLPLFQQETGLFTYGWESPIPSQLGLSDKAALHLLNKYDFLKWKTAYPGYVWYANRPDNWLKALPDYGAAAMIGVGKDIAIPVGTRSIRVRISFTHDSPMFRDINPQSKGWTSQELYSDETGQTSGVSKRLVEYGNPRCGITKMKLVLFPNKIELSEDYVSYNLPPDYATVLGLQKARYRNPDAFNTADASGFDYTFVQPTDPIVETQFIDPNTLAANESSYLNYSVSVIDQNTANESQGASTMTNNDIASIEDTRSIESDDISVDLFEN